MTCIYTNKSYLLTYRNRFRHNKYARNIANTDNYKCNISPQTIRDLNALPDSLISSTEGAEDGVAKFNSLVRARV